MKSSTATKPLMKPPISYYGGKQNMLSKILPLIPDHTLYAEPFFGGGSVFFAKAPSKVEVINDTNSQLITFYRVIQNQFDKLKAKVDQTLHSRRQHKDAQTIYSHPHLFDEVQQAWAVFVLATESFCSLLDGSFGYDKNTNRSIKKTQNTVARFTEQITIRLKNAHIECADALRLIKSRDTEDSFFYIDPPYFNSDSGHYDGYTLEHFETLLKILTSINGKFLLSSYPSDLLAQYTTKAAWYTKTFQKRVMVNQKKQKHKTEVLTANYPI